MSLGIKQIVGKVEPGHLENHMWFRFPQEKKTLGPLPPPLKKIGSPCKI